MIPFCTYNTVGYREETRERLMARPKGDRGSGVGRQVPVCTTVD